jgi:hypothetical protein
VVSSIPEIYEDSSLLQENRSRKAAVATAVITVTKPGSRGLIERQHAAVHLASAAGGYVLTSSPDKSVRYEP